MCWVCPSCAQVAAGARCEHCGRPRRADRPRRLPLRGWWASAVLLAVVVFDVLR